MTIKELKEILEQYDDNQEIWVYSTVNIGKIADITESGNLIPTVQIHVA